MLLAGALCWEEAYVRSPLCAKRLLGSPSHAPTAAAACRRIWQESVPERFGEFEYWSRQTPAAPRVVLLRRRTGGGAEEVVLDSNLFPEDSELAQVLAGRQEAARFRLQHVLE